MRKFIVRVLLFLAIMFVVDRMVGMALNYISSHPRGGMTLRRNYITDHSTEDVLIMGSSRAHYHYNPQIIKDSLGMSSFNCGENAMGIVLFYSWWKIISERYHPRLVIYDVSPEFDIRKGNNYEFLWRLRRFYDQKQVHAVFDEVAPKERWKMISRMYRYNSTFTELAADIIHPMKEQGNNGFVAVNRKVNQKYINKRPKYENKKITPDSLKINLFEKMIKEMGSTRLVLVVSPYLTGINDSTFNSISNLSQKYGIPFLDYSNDPKYLRKGQYFYDPNHLNAEGADVFTREMVKDIKVKIGCNLSTLHGKR